MNRLVWMLAALYVALGAGLFYGLAIDSTRMFLTVGGVLVLLALPQWFLLSRHDDRASDPTETLPRDRT